MSSFLYFPTFSSFDYPGLFNWLTFHFINHCFALSNILFYEILRFSYFIFTKSNGTNFFFVLFVYIQDSSEVFSFIVLNILIIVILSQYLIYLFQLSSFTLVLFGPVSCHVYYLLSWSQQDSKTSSSLFSSSLFSSLTLKLYLFPHSILTPICIISVSICYHIDLSRPLYFLFLLLFPLPPETYLVRSCYGHVR